MECEKLLALAERFLNEQGQQYIQAILADGNLRMARVYLLGALDRKMQNNTLLEAELTAAYQDLGLNPEEVADIRNRQPRF